MERETERKKTIYMCIYIYIYIRTAQHWRPTCAMQTTATAGIIPRKTSSRGPPATGSASIVGNNPCKAKSGWQMPNLNTLETQHGWSTFI